MIRSLPLALVLFGASPALAQTFVDPAEVDRAVAQFTGAPIGAPGGGFAPYARSEGTNNCHLSPTFIFCSASVQPGITSLTPNSAGSPP